MTRIALTWLLLAGLWLVAGPVGAQERPEQTDIRLVVDISGSMKRTDPDNLRRPALELMVRLLPERSAAGVWTFGQSVNALIPHGEVTDQWQANALERVDDINSVALYTHIGAALEAAAFDREQRSGEAPPAHIVLLTDGMVDVSPDSDVNAREQARVMESLVPELKEAGYRLHTIGLSDEADESLLRQIARDADGLFSRARNADDLMDSLLQIFQQTVPADQLPIEGGIFLIDDTVEEFTALIRREPDQSATELTDPEGQVYRRGEDNGGVHWHHTRDYDLITVTDPADGRWEIDTRIQPQSRLTVVSNLRLVVEPLPNNMNVGEPLDIEFYLQDRNGVVENAELLEVLELDVVLAGPDDSDRSEKRWSAEPPEDGRYTMTLPAPRRPGEYELRLTLDGKSFERLFTHRLMVASQFDVSLEKSVDDDDVNWRVTVDGKDTVNPEQTSVVAHVRHSGGYSSVEPLPVVDSGVWVHELTPRVPANYRVALQASGETESGRSFEEHLPSQYFRYPEEGDPAPDPKSKTLAALKQELEQRKAGGNDVDNTLPGSTLSAGETVQQPASNGVGDTGTERGGAHPALLIGALVLANGLLLALAYLGYRYIMKTPVGTPQEEGDADSAESDEEASPPPAMQQIDTNAELDSLERGIEEPPATESTDDTGDDEEPLFPLDDDKLFDDDREEGDR